MTGADFDAVVVGGGFYGCCLGAFLRNRLAGVAVVEKHDDLLTRASYANQARVHNGYHYPRSFLTAVRSAVNFPRFVLEFRDCIDDGFQKLYAIARRDSKVTAYQFEKFCRQIGAPLSPAGSRLGSLFNPDLVEAVYAVREYAFDAARLRERMRSRLIEAGVHVLTGTEVRRVAAGAAGRIALDTTAGEIRAGAVFNCTYSQLNVLLKRSGLPALPLKHEITEIALVAPPDDLHGLGVTVMDGPFFSTMPFPAEALHSLTHVRYTPHESWQEPATARDPHGYLSDRQPQSKFVFMVRDAQRYLPCLSRARHVRSIFEVKTVLCQNEADDGRPILFRSHPEVGRMITVMGGKIDNIYDVLEAMNRLHGLTAA
jgi:glycine/D-amino acid oxidase-like deaminating enzyme